MPQKLAGEQALSYEDHIFHVLQTATASEARPGSPNGLSFLISFKKSNNANEHILSIKISIGNDTHLLRGKRCRHPHLARCAVFPGGLSSFKQNHENLCDNSLQLQECREAGGGAAAPSPPPQPAPATPDIESAELTPILPFLYLGNEQDAQDLDAMRRLNIGYVINVTTHLPLFHYEKGLFSYKRLPATDSNKQNLRQYFEEAFEFIGKCLPRGFPAAALRLRFGSDVKVKADAWDSERAARGVFGSSAKS